ncbi:MAG: ATP-dependent helicase [Candidatus Altiarchaeales archaeon]|nr:ATP-dependent helicase [Candidatus Altiarchaeales archaeon]MBD3417298.1 ATP-dependent helicase [Candidatus Altiarchaeales archaeon]
MIEVQEEPYRKEEILRELHPLVREWFNGKYGDFAPPQLYAIPNIMHGKNTLVSAPTGSGKTLTAFMSVLNKLIEKSLIGDLEEKVYCLYVSPLKALNNDIHRNLEEPLAELEELHGKELGIRAMVRTGDTPTSKRAAMLRKPPHILITTPESLALMLTSPKFSLKLKDVKWMILDEVHALAENKRGVDLSLSIERLQNHAGRFTRIGLSATIHPLEKVAEYVVGYEGGKPRDCRVVDVRYIKELDIKVLSPVKNIIAASQDEMSNSLYKLLDDLIQEHKTTLVFTNTRSGTERVVSHLKTRYPGRYMENIGAHHSSLSAEHRLDIEERLKKGELKVVVSSTSLELGIDIGYIDLVVLLGSPKSVARALQRIGRSGHQLHEKAKGRIIVLDRDDLVECSVLLKNAVEGRIDDIHIPENCLDVLSQQIYGIAIANREHVDNVYEMVRRSYCYRNLRREDFDSVMQYLRGDYVELEQRSVYAKIWVDDETRIMGKRGKLARVIYSTNLGTIPEESFVTVKVGEHKVGKLDEPFLERLSKGDIFVLGGKIYKFRYCRGMTCQVTPDAGPPTVPSWVSESLPLSYGLSLEIQRFRRLMEERMDKPKEDVKEWLRSYLYADENAVESIYQYFWEQHRYAMIPHDGRIVIEYNQAFKKRYIVFHSLFGRRVNDALSRAVAYAIARKERKNVAISLSDNGFYLTVKGKVQAANAFKTLTPAGLRSVLVEAIDKTEVLLRRFRHCATRSLMMLRNYKGRSKSVGRQQLGSKILLNFVRKLDPHFPILEEARREVLEDLMDVENATEVLSKIAGGEIEVREISTDIPTPFALNLIGRGYMDVMRTEDRLEFIRRMHEALLERIR